MVSILVLIGFLFGRLFGYINFLTFRRYSSQNKLRQIPNRLCNIVDYGAIRSPNDSSEVVPSQTVDSNIEAFADAIQNCHDRGGGSVKIPAGTL